MKIITKFYTFWHPLPIWVKNIAWGSLDIILLASAFYIALWMRYGDAFDNEKLVKGFPLLGFLILLFLGSSIIFRIHRIVVSKLEMRAIVRLALWVGVISIFSFVINLIMGLGAPRSVPLILGLVFLLLVVGVRGFVYRIMTRWYRASHPNAPRIAIFGAGSAGMQLAAALRYSPEYRLRLFIDDNTHLHGLNMAGLRVCSRTQMEDAIKKKKIDQVLIAIPSLSVERRKKLLKDIEALGCKAQALPSYLELIQSDRLLGKLENLKDEDLLGRDYAFDEDKTLFKSYHGHCVLVTGAGGSIGSELCHQLVGAQVGLLVILDHCEYNLFEIESALKDKVRNAGGRLLPILGSILDKPLIERIIAEQNIDTLIHAAAYKHVPIIEDHPVQGLRNNVLGTRILAEAALKAGSVARFLFISSDKAVRPTSLMGATKRLAELLLQDYQRRTDKTYFTIVRFGNVLGSSGSVIPTFRRQIEAGGPVTLTDPDMTRYFMTISEAAHLVLLAASFDKTSDKSGGDVFVLDMGKPVKIITLARNMIELSGLSIRDENDPRGDIEIKIIGPRPGEKLYEELLYGSDVLKTQHPKIMRQKVTRLEPETITEMLQDIEEASLKQDGQALREICRRFVFDRQCQSG